MMGWEEILAADLSPTTIVECWHGYKAAVKAARRHHYVVMAANDYLYFNFPKANPKKEPIAQLHEGRLIPLRKVYSFDPIPDKLTKEQVQFIIGVEAALWTEYIGSPRKAEFMAYPRALALAEIAWSPKNERNWNDFWRRLQLQFKRFDVMDVDYSKLYKGQKPHVQLNN